ncbi:hypothetical protein B0H16DRAFT_167196 [Mycena metata]|uniref:NACHT domain-containing protein n=1 Tax=Mycena metata TaxID=1033252 RepID=A0AAD7JXB6_9AGAR|nr:hypothetical protein B0H16DRAFT_167196 [Mycena metata]
MADPLGTVASILQLVDTALKIRDHIQDFRHAPQEQQELLKEMDYLRNLLDHIHTYIARNPSDATLKRMESPLTTFKLMMMQVTEKLRLGGGLFSKFSKRMKWTMGDKQAAEEYLKKFDQFKLLLNSWLVIHLGEIGQKNHQDSNEHLVHIEQQHQRENNDLLRSLDDVAKTLNSGVTNIINGISEQQTQSNLDDVAAVVNTGVTKIANSISEQQQQMGCAERTRIIDWLSPINFFLRHADVARTQQAGTGRWLLAEPRFQDWKASAGRTLWCPGIPGAGKTVLTSMVVDHFAAAECENNTIGVACVYLNHKEADNHTPSRLLAGLWRQLVLDRDIGSLAAKLYSQHQEKRTFPSLEEVVDVLRSSLDVFSRVYVIVDALDECPEAQRWIFLRHLAALGPTVNLMITSRPHITPEASHRNLDILEIRAIDEDVRTYADARIEHSPRLSKHVQAVPELRLEILSKIVDGVDGM